MCIWYVNTLIKSGFHNFGKHAQVKKGPKYKLTFTIFKANMQQYTYFTNFAIYKLKLGQF